MTDFNQLYRAPPSQQPQGGGSAGSSNEFFMSPEMLKLGLSAGQDILSKQRDRWMPGVSSLWETLRFYFAVDNMYVFKKLKILFYPLGHKQWSRRLADEGTGDALMIASHKWATPRFDINSPDLYIPLMAFFTYALLVGFSKGLEVKFSPDVLTVAIWRCLALQTIESLVIKFGLNIMSVSLPFLDVFAYTGYKYVGLCFNLLTLVIRMRIVYYVSAVYTSSMLAFFVLKSMAAVVPPATATGPPRHLMLIAFAGLQFFVAYVLTMF